MQQGALGKSAQKFVRALDNNICPAGYRVRRQCSTKFQMCSVSLVHDQHLSPFVKQLRNGGHITDSAVIGGIDQDHPLYLWMLCQFFFYLLRGNAFSKAQPSIVFRFKINALYPAQCQPRINRTVAVQRHQKAVAFPANAHNSTLYAGCAATHQNTGLL